MSHYIDIECCVCGEVFGMDGATCICLRRSRITFYCPYGHKQHFTTYPEKPNNIVRLSLVKNDEDES